MRTLSRPLSRPPVSTPHSLLVRVLLELLLDGDVLFLDGDVLLASVHLLFAWCTHGRCAPTVCNIVMASPMSYILDVLQRYASLVEAGGPSPCPWLGHPFLLLGIITIHSDIDVPRSEA